MDKVILVSKENIRKALVSWIEEADVVTLSSILYENFDEGIHYNPKIGLFEVPSDEAERLGLLEDGI